MQAAANAVQGAMGSIPTTVKAEYAHDPSGKTMKALAWFGSSDVRLVDAPVPAIDITEPDDVILKVTATTICGSDLHLYHGEIATLQKGDILGHEFLGIVDKVGPNVTNIKPGQRVVASFQIACGECEFCKKKLSTFCDRTNDSSLMNYMYGARDAGIFGYSHLTGGFPGGQAEYVRVPKGNVNLLPIPDSVPDDAALYLSDILPTSYHSVVDTGVEKGDIVAIWGLGPIGACAAKWAQLKGASRVIGIDRVPYRLNMAKEKLGIETINIDECKDIPARIREMVGDKGVDVCLCCDSSFREPKTLVHKVQKALMLETDSPEVLNEMLLAVRKMGRVGIIADMVGYANGVNVGALMEKGVRVIGNGQAPSHLYWQEILEEYLMSGAFDPSFLVTHRVPLEDMPDLYVAFDHRVPGLEKVIVDTKFSNEFGKRSAKCPPLTRVRDWAFDSNGKPKSFN